MPTTLSPVVAGATSVHWNAMPAASSPCKKISAVNVHPGPASGQPVVSGHVEEGSTEPRRLARSRRWPLLGWGWSVDLSGDRASFLPNGGKFAAVSKGITHEEKTPKDVAVGGPAGGKRAETRQLAACFCNLSRYTYACGHPISRQGSLVLVYTRQCRKWAGDH